MVQLSSVAARGLAKHQGHLALPYLGELLVPAAEALAMHQGRISFRVSELLLASAGALATHRGDIQLEGPWRSWSETAAKEYAEGGVAYGLSILYPVVAEVFARSNVDLGIDVLRKPSTAVAGTLAQKHGTICSQKPADGVASLRL